MNVSGRDPLQLPGDARLPIGGGMSRRLLLGFGGVMVLGGCASKGATSAATGLAGATNPGGSTTPGAGTPTGSSSPSGSAPTSRLSTGGAPFPGQSPSGSDTSSSASGTHTGDAPPVAGHPQFYVHEGDKAIALTIDDGPSSKYTPQVLELLAQYKIPATFCMIGESAEKHASLVAEVSAAGHLVANHTWTHPNLSKMTAAHVTAEIERTNDAITKGGAKQPVLFRAPGGNWSPTVFQVCAKLGLRPLDWSVDPRDWSRPGTDHIVSTVMGHTKTGSIILEHDGGGDRSQTVTALQRFLPQLLEAGYRFVQP
ncbi:peptidoglycan/xylan/chitin deacetylase (PgdA/CDA1 family) [Catenulispora sp. GAS73]|uniref:polysaccharide deacetylase family protein n=1 Tax=Catenulispora sp. GAS73 TaxID=3156269 RepID=UPI0035152092